MPLKNTTVTIWSFNWDDGGGVPAVYVRPRGTQDLVLIEAMATTLELDPDHGRREQIDDWHNGGSGGWPSDYEYTADLGGYEVHPERGPGDIVETDKGELLSGPAADKWLAALQERTRDSVQVAMTTEQYLDLKRMGVEVEPSAGVTVPRVHARATIVDNRYGTRSEVTGLGEDYVEAQLDAYRLATEICVSRNKDEVGLRFVPLRDHTDLDAKAREENTAKNAARQEEHRQAVALDRAETFLGVSAN
jgi:hypothetical protein